ncbi:MAG TPA: metallophosphoesterase [Gammaproteobacteria bacterium]|nr:metallophosphoesterase [Gammaproteobacteria bacterium]
MATVQGGKNPSSRRSLRRARITIILIAILLVLFGVPWWTLVAAGARWPSGAFIGATAAAVAALLGFFPLMYLGHRKHQDWAARIGDMILGVIWVLFAWSVLGNVLRLGLALDGVGALLRSRIVTAVVVVVSVALMLWGWFEATRVPRVKRVRVPIDGLDPGLDGLRVVQLSDIHYGPIDRTRWAQRVVAAVNSLDADVVCITGDIADGTVAQRRRQAASLKDIRARLAKVYVLGNHEHFGQAREWLDYLRGMGWEPLCNRHITVCREGAALVVAGVDDASVSRSCDGDLAAALAGVDEALPVLLLAHQPKQVDAAAARGIDLQLSGHTHGGQIWPFGLIVRLAQPSIAGLTRHGERTWLYTSRGTGFWGPPLRIFEPSEITLLTLTAAA